MVPCTDKIQLFLLILRLLVLILTSIKIIVQKHYLIFKTLLNNHYALIIHKYK